MKIVLILLMATFGLGISMASADSGNVHILLNSCDSQWFRNGEDCISYTGECPEMYTPGQGNCSFPTPDQGRGDDRDRDDRGHGPSDGAGPGYGHVMSVDQTAESLQPSRSYRNRGGNGCYRVCEYLYKG
jgi:hypothetical protein